MKPTMNTAKPKKKKWEKDSVLEISSELPAPARPIMQCSSGFLKSVNKNSHVFKSQYEVVFCHLTTKNNPEDCKY